MRSAGDSAILCRTRELLRAATSNGNGAWWYYFTATPIFSVNEPAWQMPYMGAFHGAEVPFVWGDTFELKSEGERILSRTMGCYWTNFASTGNPNHGPSGCAAALNLPEWPVFGEDTDAISFPNSTISIRRGLKKEQCDIFVQYANTGRSELLMV
uniref:Carboxylesterase type B domain-containing protein n=1 Tax=Alexandrium andersonii TaxID=327968 RepID=A0A7S2N025_9DINO